MSDVMTRLAELPPEQRRLLELRLKEAQARKARALGPRARTGQPIPLSFSQRRLWFLERLNPGTADYNLPAPIRLRGPLDVRALERALNALRARHEALRTTFAERDGEPVQVIHPFAPAALAVDDLSQLPADAREAEARRIASDDAHAGFNLARGPLFRARVVRLGDEEHLLLLTLHHAIGDAWSLGVLTREMERLYDAFAQGRPDPLDPPALQFADFAAWQHEHLDAATVQRHLAFWRRVLEGAPPVLELPEYHPAPSGHARRGEMLERRIAPALAERVRAVAAAEDATPFAVLIAAFRLALARHAGHGDVVLGTAAAGRERRELAGVVGFVANTLALRTDLGGDPEFRALVRRERDTLLDAFEHQALPFERVVEELKLSPDPGRNPVFQAMITYQGMADFQGGGTEALRLGEARGRWEAVDFHPARFDLAAAVVQDGDELWVQLEWDAALLDRPSAERIAAHFLRLLEHGAEDPGRRLPQLDVMDAEERALVLGPWTRGADLPPAEAAAHRLFEAHVAATPDAPALVDDGGTVSYAELDARATAIARRLRALGVGMETRVGVAMERSPGLVAALLGVLKAGGVYVPLDPGLPGERLAWMAGDAGIVALVAGGALASELAALGIPTIDVDGDEDADESSLSLPDVPAEAAAYVIYTSGSTGRPKGVAVQHGELARHCRGAALAFGLSADDRLLQFMAPGFDVSIEQMLAPLAAGACIVQRGELPSTAELAALVRERGVTVVNPPTSYWHQLADDAPARDAVKAAARLVMAGGEAMRADAARAWAAAPGGARLLNMYGPTEAVVSCTAFEVGPGFAAGNEPRVPLGTPIPGRRAYVLDAALNPCGVGIPGELCVGGVLARGYPGRPGATAAAFVPDPFSPEPGARLYRTGDRVRWTESAAVRECGSALDSSESQRTPALPHSRTLVLDFLGRADQQVKVRGFRIEPGEVEAALRALDFVADAVVAPRPGPGGADRLVAWVVSADGALDDEELRDGLRRVLPHYLVPAAFVAIDAVPLTANGKVDRSALPDPAAERGDEFVAPRTETERVLAELWAPLLGVERAGAGDDFFAQGGHSLLAVRLVSRIRDVLGVELPLRVIFEAPTLSALAARIDAARGEDAASPAAAPIPRADRSAPLPLSFAQERLWFLDQLEPGSSHYNVPMALEISGPVDAAALERALGEIVRRHEALRTAFVPGADGPVQRILPPDAFRASFVELSSSPDPTGDAERWMGEEARRPFDLAAGPLIRATLLRLGAETHTLLTVFHHAASDAWSAGVFLRELSALYAAFRDGRESPLPEPPLQYADFSAWQRGWLVGDELERQLAFWRERLRGAPATLDLPTDRPRPAVQDLAGAAYRFELSAEAGDAVRTLAARAGEGATPFMVLLAAFAAVLHRWSGQDDVVVGTPVASRGRAELEELIGFFGNTLPLRADLAGDPPFGELLARVRATTVDAFAHQDVPFEKLVDALGVERSLSHSPLFQVMLTLQNAAEGDVELAGAEVRLTAPDLATSRFDLTVGLWETEDGFGGWAEYATALWDEDTIARLAGHLDALLRAAATSPGAPVSALPIISADERAQVVSAFNATDRPEFISTSVVEMVAARAARAPDVAALEFGGETLTYAETESRANRLAHRLIGLGVRADARVAICLERSLEMPIAVLAVLKAGGAYVAVDPNYPADRVAYMLEDSRASVVITTSDVAARLPSVAGTTVVRLDAEADAISRESSASPSISIDPGQLGYVLYTSGSTGKPKGAALPHRALANMVRWQIDRWGDDAPARTLQFASLSFDVSFQEIFSTWAAGGTLVLIDDETRRDAERLIAHLRDERIERLFLPFAALQNLAETAGDSAHLPHLREVITAGEALRSTPQLRAFFRANPQAALENQYGPSETHVVSAHVVAGDAGDWPALPPIGAPIANTRLYVLDARMEPVPLGVPGELFAGGDCLARGYLGRPALTAEKFVPDPFSALPGARLYRTGDRVRWMCESARVRECESDSSRDETTFAPSHSRTFALEYVGRTDFQVKIRGFRVEPGEVEAVLGTHSSVKQAAVAARGEGAERRLVGYVVPVDGAAPTHAELRTHVAAHLPEYMVPAAWVVLERMPLTPSGKVDRRSLPEPDPAALAAGKVPPRTPAEEVIAAVWERVLGVYAGVHDDFFALGGHSLRATQVIARIREAFGIDLPLRALFEAPTVAGLAERAVAARAGEEHRVPPLVPAGRGRTIPLSFAQQRFWFLETLGAAPAAYNVPVVLRLRGELDADALRRALDGVVARHEALRTVFPTGDGGPVQEILPALSIPLPVVDLSSFDEVEREARAKAISDDESRAPFDLAAGPLLRARLLRLAGDEHLLLLTLHHVVVDAWSLGVLYRELSALYAGEIEGRDAGLPPLPVQYADYAVWQRERLDGPALEREMAYWRGALDGAATLALPTDRPHPAVQSFRGATHAFSLPRATWEAATALARRSGATPFMVLLAAFDAVLHRWSGTDDVVVGSPVAGRTPEQTEPLIGVFLNTLALRADLSGDPTFAQMLGRVRETTLDAYAHQEVPFERLVEELKIERSLTRHPLFQVIFSMHAQSSGAPVLPGLQVEAGEGDTGTTKVDLVLAVAEHEGSLHGVFQYASDLWDADSIERMAAHFGILLAAAAGDPEQRISELPLMPPEEEALVTVAWNRTEADYPRGITIPHLFEGAVDATPDAIAVSHADGALTYRALDERANRLAHRLVRLGIGPEARVAVCMERTPELVVALLAVLKAGGGYVPVDPAYPAERIAWMLEDSGAPVLLTHARLAERLPAISGTVIRVDADWAEIESAEPGDRPRVAVHPENTAYTIYTSGSTGRPKGVQIEHRSTVTLLHWLKEHVSDEERRAVLGSTSVSFDVSIAEIFGTLCWGGRLILVRNALAVDGIPPGEAPVLASMAPSAAAELLRTGAIPPSVRVLNLGGEALPNALAQGLLDTGTVERVVNLYGPTEDTTYSTYSVVERDGERVWIGRPVANTRAWVVDAALRTVPVGVPGELYLSGEGLSRGYHRRPALTAERFVPCPFGPPGSRMYRVGDRVRWRADGNLDYLGRLDHQVKIRGHRVETGEIEAVLAEHPALQEAAVVVRGEGADVRLAAFVVSAAGEVAPGAAELRAFLKERLPDYMVPAAFTALERLPLSPNGKVDRLSLAEHEPAEAAREERAEPATVSERAIARVWEEVLEISGVGMDDNFFEIGGHSLVVGRMIERLRAALGVEVTPVELFLYPTVRSLAAHLASAAATTAAGETKPDAKAEAKAGESAERGSGRREMMGRLRRR
ncbi:MAG TPA: amino acid adenylation domain-containing protein [Longimicrobium sp.]